MFRRVAGGPQDCQGDEYADRVACDGMQARPPRWCGNDPRLAPHPPWSTRAWMAASTRDTADAAAGGSGLVRDHVVTVPRYRRLSRPRVEHPEAGERVRVQGLRDRFRPRPRRTRPPPRGPPATEPDRVDLLRPRRDSGNDGADDGVRALGPDPPGGATAGRPLRGV